MEKLYRSAILIHDQKQFKHHAKLGILSTPITSTSTELTQAIDKFHHKIMDNQVDEGKYATLFFIISINNRHDR